MPDDVSIRPATVFDADRLVELDRLTWSPIVSPAPAPTGGVDPFERHAVDDYLVAEVAGPDVAEDPLVVGFVILGEGFGLPTHAHVRQIAGLGVDPAHTGRGVGAALVEAAVEEHRARGARKVILRVMGHNTPAQSVYRRAGFVVEGHLVDEFLVDGEYVDDYLMARHLHDG